MLLIVVPECEAFDEDTNRFISVKRKYELQLEHSLISISKWESRYKKPYLHTEQMTLEEESYYIECMCLNKNVPEYVFKCIPDSEKIKIRDYINDPMTATIINIKKQNRSKQLITNELIYYWMISLNIPMECEKWHLSRLMTLIQVASIKNSAGQDKMSKREVAQYQQQVNQARRQALAEKKGLKNK